MEKKLFLCVSLFYFFMYLQNFKREEQNFVVMNEINNMSFLTADSKSKMSKVSQRVHSDAIIQISNVLVYFAHKLCFLTS